MRLKILTIIGFLALLFAMTPLGDHYVIGTVHAAPSDFTSADIEDVNNQLLEDINPLRSSGSDHADTLSTPGGILSRFLVFAFPIAGLILFVMIVWGGFEMLAGSASKKSIDAGKQRITTALLGFLLLFVSFWIIQIVEQTLGIRIFMTEAPPPLPAPGARPQ